MNSVFHSQIISRNKIVQQLMASAWRNGKSFDHSIQGSVVQASQSKDICFHYTSSLTCFFKMKVLVLRIQEIFSQTSDWLNPNRTESHNFLLKSVNSIIFLFRLFFAIFHNSHLTKKCLKFTFIFHRKGLWHLPRRTLHSLGKSK